MAKGLGTIAFRDSWDIFDQIMVSVADSTKFSSLTIGKQGYTTNLFLIQTSGQGVSKTAFRDGSWFQ
jgi:hypothetical protein